MKSIKYNNIKLECEKRRTIEQQEDIIINKFGGRKLDLQYFYSHLTEFYRHEYTVKSLKTMSPCKIIFDCTEMIIPEEYFYAFYIIPVKEELKTQDLYCKETIVAVTSKDGKYVYASDFVAFMHSTSIEFDMSLHRSIPFADDGVEVYFDEI